MVGVDRAGSELSTIRYDHNGLPGWGALTMSMATIQPHRGPLISLNESRQRCQSRITALASPPVTSSSQT